MGLLGAVLPPPPFRSSCSRSSFWAGASWVYMLLDGWRFWAGDGWVYLLVDGFRFWAGASWVYRLVDGWRCLAWG